MDEKSVGHYKLVERLGAGGMGEVYRAHDQRLNRTVAVKMLSGTDEARRRRFWQEAQAASALNHPNIITMHDMVTEGDVDYLVMEYVAGQTLAELIPPGGMPLEKLLPVATQMAGALAAAHAAGIIHRDIKPANIMVSASGLVKVLDFGLAKRALPEATPAEGSSLTLTVAPAPLTVAGSILGTVSYMSPEQAEGQTVDARSDMFSFGAVLYEMATGSMAFQGQSLVSTLTAILRDEPKPIPEVAPAVPPALVELIRRSLRKSPAERWASMAEVEAKLNGLKQLADTQQLVEMAAPAKRGVPGWAIGLGVFAVFVGGGWLLTQRESPAPVPVVERPPMPTSTPPAKTNPSETVLTNQGVIEMVQAKVPAGVIISHVRTATSTEFDTSTQGLIDLAKAGVPENVIREMSSRWRQAPARLPAAPRPEAAAKPVEAAALVQLADGRPLELELLEDIPADAEPGTALRFAVKSPLVVAGMTVVPAGAPVAGEIAEGGKRRFPGMGSKLMYRLKQAVVAGQALRLRAQPVAKNDQRRPVETPSGTKSKTVAAAQGTLYLGYVDGDQSLPGR